VSISTFNKIDNSTKPICNAKKITPETRQNIGAQAVAQVTSVTKLADENGTSRKFIYDQKGIADKALNEAFKEKNDDSDVLFYIPVTKQWLRQFILCLILVGHCSYRGVKDILCSLFDYSISIGSIHNIVQDTVKDVKELHKNEDLSGIRIGAPDEIFQGGKPVLAACDTRSLYCYLLKPAEHRDAETWAIHLMECQEKGLNLDYTVADFGSGLRAGQKEAMPDIECLGDHFHVLYDMGKSRIYLENRAYRMIKYVDALEKKMTRAKKKGKGNKLSKKMAFAKAESLAAINLSDDFTTLTVWVQEILSPIGPDFRTRGELFDFIVEELIKMESKSGKHRIIPIRRILENNKKEILGFALLIDEKWNFLSEELGVSTYLLRKMYELQSMSIEDIQRHELEIFLRKSLSGKFYFVYEAVSQIEMLVTRASSAIENFNSRLRNYFFLRKQLGPDYLELLRFFLNQHSFLASDDSRRSGRSPAEIMKGKNLPHWLEQLGYTLFKRAA
jgi:hypothetical protein